MARRACLAIGVGWVMPLDDEPLRFEYLDGAVLAARAIGEWARRSGFGADNVRVVDDGRVNGKENPVTCERVQQAVDELFPQNAEVVEHHLILAFCGHGLTDGNFNSMSWLFSDSQLKKYRVIWDRFHEQLLYKGVQRISLFADACREGSKELAVMRWKPDSGIVAHGKRVERPKLDTFAACQDGQQGFMVSVPNSGNPGKCIFSGVIADVLCGLEPEAIDNGVITTLKFSECVESRTIQRASDYHLKLNPECRIAPPAVVLYDAAKPPQPPLELQPWPRPQAVATGAGAPMDGEATEERGLLDGFLAKFRVRSRDGWLRAHIPEARREPEPVPDARQRAADEVQRSLMQIGPMKGLHDSNLIVFGRRATLWSREPVERRRQTPTHMEFRIASDAQIPILIELAEDVFTPVVPYAELYAVVKQSATDDVLQVYGELQDYGQRKDSRDAYERAVKAIADLTAGRIKASRIDELAGDLRHNKHTDPVLGAICAYLYRAIADFDSIYRMAYFYCKHGQPVPFDIALLGAMTVTRDPNGTLSLQVPAVNARKPEEGAPHLPEYVTEATPAREASIGGRCPWLGLGWDYVTSPRPEWAALVDGLAEHARAVRRSGFTVLPRPVGLALARSWGLQQR
jgi:hypothetical protein